LLTAGFLLRAKVWWSKSVEAEPVFLKKKKFRGMCHFSSISRSVLKMISIMTQRVMFLFVLALGVLLSCEERELSNEIPINEQEKELAKGTVNADSTFQSCDSVYVATRSGTACCVSGPVVAKPGDIFRYHYQINHADAQVSWQILEGDISIIAGQGTHTVTVQFGENFTTGIIFGDGNGLKDGQWRLRCTDRAIVTSD
jgi:hypothetical protein